jgi:hypothetical protein
MISHFLCPYSHGYLSTSPFPCFHRCSPGKDRPSVNAPRTDDWETHIYTGVTMRAPSDLCTPGDHIGKSPRGTVFVGFQRFNFVICSIQDAESVLKQRFANKHVFISFLVVKVLILCRQVFRGMGSIGKHLRIPEIFGVSLMKLYRRISMWQSNYKVRGIIRLAAAKPPVSWSLVLTNTASRF